MTQVDNGRLHDDLKGDQNCPLTLLVTQRQNTTIVTHKTGTHINTESIIKYSDKKIKTKNLHKCDGLYGYAGNAP